MPEFGAEIRERTALPQLNLLLWLGPLGWAGRLFLPSFLPELQQTLLALLWAPMLSVRQLTPVIPALVGRQEHWDFVTDPGYIKSSRPDWAIEDHPTEYKMKQSMKV